MEMTVHPYMPAGWAQLHELPVSLVPDPAPAGKSPTWGEIASAVGEMKSTMESMGWTTGVLYSFYGVCLQGSFLIRNGLLSAWAGEQNSPLGLAVAEHVWNVIRQVTSFEGIPGYSPWQSIIHFNDVVCDSRGTALTVLDIALEEALQLAALELEEVEVEVEKTPAPTLTPPPAWIPGQFTGLLSVLATTPELELASVGT